MKYTTDDGTDLAAADDAHQVGPPAIDGHDRAIGWRRRRTRPRGDKRI